MRFQALRVPKLASLESLFDILAVLSFHSWICFARRRPPWRCCGLGLRRRLSKSAPGGFPYPNLSRDASKPANETRSQFPALSYSPSWHTTVRNLMAPLRPTSLEVPKQAIWPILYGHTGTAFYLVMRFGDLTRQTRRTTRTRQNLKLRLVEWRMLSRKTLAKRGR